MGEQTPSRWNGPEPKPRMQPDPLPIRIPSDAINDSTYRLLLLRPTLGNHFCRPGSSLRLSLPCLPTQDW
jgi:hypothetical protein